MYSTSIVMKKYESNYDKDNLSINCPVKFHVQ